MAKNLPRQELLQKMEQLFRRFDQSGDLGPVQSREEWDKLLESRPAEEQRLLTELANFADLWRYLQQRKEKLGPEIVNRIGRLHELPVTERTSELKEINQTLLNRVKDADPDSRLRH